MANPIAESASPFDFTGVHMTDDSVPFNSPMQDFYRDKKVLLTGATGYLGQLFAEKLLRIGVRELFVIVRQKDNYTEFERIRSLFTGPLFAKLSGMDENYMNRVTVISGDMSKLDLGISDVMQDDLKKNLNAIIHATGGIRFDLSLQELVLSEVRGTRELIKLAKHCKKLKNFAYISTVYSYKSKLNVITEDFNDNLINPNTLIKLVENAANGNILEPLADLIIQPFNCKYSFAKAMAEELLRQASNELNCVIIRPSLIISTFEDPITSWCSNMYSLEGIFASCGMGILRILPFKKNNICHLVCSDFVTNSTLIALWYNCLNRYSNQPMVYNITVSNDTITFGKLCSFMKTFLVNSPFVSSLWYPSIITTNCSFIIKWGQVLAHLVPGMFCDLFYMMINKTTRLLPAYRRILIYTNELKRFTEKSYNIEMENIKTAKASMNPVDHVVFPTEFAKLQWKDYGYPYILGLRTYMAKENIQNMDTAIARTKKLMLIHYGLITGLMYTLVHFIVKMFIDSYFD